MAFDMEAYQPAIKILKHVLLQIEDLKNWFHAQIKLVKIEFHVGRSWTLWKTKMKRFHFV
jgi:hypothetical protein